MPDVTSLCSVGRGQALRLFPKSAMPDAMGLELITKELGDATFARTVQ